VRRERARPEQASRGPRGSTAGSKVRFFLTLLAAGCVVGVSIPAPAAAWAPPGFLGFVTHDDLFFVEFGAVDFGIFTPVANDSSIYTSALELNVTSIASYNETAVVRLYSYDQGRYIENTSVYIATYGYAILTLPLPDSHTYTEFLLTVDGTPAFFWAESPYAFLGIPQLLNGGIDLAVFIAIGIFLLYTLPLMVKAERMTKRAIYCPRWNATMWLHGIFFGLLAWYIVSFAGVNAFFKGWEFVFIPFPEALFLFFWNAGRHSTNRQAMFMQVVPRLGQRMGVILRFFYIGQDADGDLVIIKRRSPVQWWYRSRGHHTKVFRRSEEGALEPFPFVALEQQRISSEQVRDPARFPRGAKYGGHDDFPVINAQDDEEAPIERVYFVPRISAFRHEWPKLRFFREVKVPTYVDINGSVHEGETRLKLTWPYIQDGHADISLWSWHFMDVLAQAQGYMTSEDMAREIEDLSMQLAAERGNRERLSREKAESRMGADADLRGRPYSDMSPEELQAYRSPDRKKRPAIADRGGEPA
jgi:hypothetical protein